MVTEQVDAALRKQEIPSRVILGYQVVLPLLMESKAIAAHVAEHPELKAALPEVLNRQEATSLMILEFRLSPEEEQKLMQLLPQTLESLHDLWQAPIDSALFSNA
jgi:hypothetical protein